MGAFDALYNFGAVGTKRKKKKEKVEGADAPGAGTTPVQFVYITKESLTFPGCATVALVATGLLSLIFGWKLPNVAVSATVGAVVGAFLCALAIAKATAAEKAEPAFMLTSIGIAVANTIFLIASIQGVAAVAAGTTDTTTPSAPAVTQPTGTTGPGTTATTEPGTTDTSERGTTTTSGG